MAGMNCLVFVRLARWMVRPACSAASEDARQFMRAKPGVHMLML
jgi:hypothetical protein